MTKAIVTGQGFAPEKIIADKIIFQERSGEHGLIVGIYFDQSDRAHLQSKLETGMRNLKTLENYRDSPELVFHESIADQNTSFISNSHKSNRIPVILLKVSEMGDTNKFLDFVSIYPTAIIDTRIPMWVPEAAI